MTSFERFYSKIKTGFEGSSLSRNKFSIIGIIVIFLVIPLTVFLVLINRGIAPKASTPIAGFREELVVSGLVRPTSMVFTPDNRIFVAEQGGRIRVIKNASTNPTLLSTPFFTLSNINSNGERGLLGIEIDPNFTSNGYVYVFYTSTNPNVHNRISRFTANGDVAVGGETVIMDLTPLSSNENHNGGAIHFGNDNKLYIGTGDNRTPSNAQNTGNLLGKILRINAVPDNPGTPVDERIPSDNPTSFTTTNGVQTTSGINRAIWALGFRNPFTFAVDPADGKIFVNDVGEGTQEEISQLVKAGNFGWPSCEGASGSCSNSAFTAPLYSYGRSVGAAITGGVFYRGNNFPSGYDGYYFFGDYSWNWIKSINPSTRVVSNFSTGAGAPVDLDIGPDGMLYHLEYSSGTVRKIYYDSAPEPPPINLWCEAESGSLLAPMTWVSDGNASNGAYIQSTVQNVTDIPPTNTGSSTMSFQVDTAATYNFWARVYYPDAAKNSFWVEFNNSGTFYRVGNDDTGFNTWKWINWQDGNTTLTIKVNLPAGTNTLKIIGREDQTRIDKILLTTSNSYTPTGIGNPAGRCSPSTPNTPPQATIATPSTTALYSYGDTINFSASATDSEDGLLPDSAFDWEIRFYHHPDPPDAHWHPFRTFSNTKSGSFVASFSEPDADVWYRFILTVTDSVGAQTSVVRDLHPRKSNITLTTNPVGINLFLDGQPKSTPHTFQSVVNFPREISAPTTATLNNIDYEFSAWSDGGSSTHTINTPSGNITYTANYQQARQRTGDINNDGSVNVLDLSILLLNWRSSDPDSDLNRDGRVNVLDLSIMLSNWG